MSVEHYENFPVASKLMPPALREPVAAIYWFARHADDLADELDIPFEWLDAPQREDVLEAARARIADALAVWQERGTTQLLDHIVRKVMTRHGVFGDDEVIGTADLLSAITNEIADELSHHIVGVPYARPFTAEDIQRVAGLKPDT